MFPATPTLTPRASVLPALLWLLVASIGAYWLGVQAAPAPSSVGMGTMALGGFATVLGAVGMVRSASGRGVRGMAGFGLPLHDVVFSAVFALTAALGLSQL